MRSMSGVGWGYVQGVGAMFRGGEVCRGAYITWWVYDWYWRPPKLVRLTSGRYAIISAFCIRGHHQDCRLAKLHSSVAVVMQMMLKM